MTTTSISQLEFVPVGDAATRNAARLLITEYLTWLVGLASVEYGLTFEVDAMVSSDLDDESKFFPPDGRFYVVRHAGAFVGVGSLKRLTPTMAEVQRMYVQPHVRGIGAGRQLVERLLADARSIGYEGVRLESLKFLAAAHTLYRSAGFAEIKPYADNSMQDYQAAEKLDTYRASAIFMELRF